MNRRSFFGKSIGAVACLFGVKSVQADESQGARDIRRHWFLRQKLLASAEPLKPVDLPSLENKP